MLVSTPTESQPLKDSGSHCCCCWTSKVAHSNTDRLPPNVAAVCTVIIANYPLLPAIPEPLVHCQLCSGRTSAIITNTDRKTTSGRPNVIIFAHSITLCATLAIIAYPEVITLDGLTGWPQIESVTPDQTTNLVESAIDQRAREIDVFD